MKFKIGETVRYLIEPKALYNVVATKAEPYDGRGSSPYNQLITPSNDNDYVIVEEGIDGFARFHHVKETELEKI